MIGVKKERERCGELSLFNKRGRFVGRKNKEIINVMRRAIVVLVCMIAMSVQMSAEAFIDGKLKCTINEDGKSVTVARNGDIEGELVIPSEVENDGTKYSVTGIGNSAFIGCKGLTAVTIPEGVTSIGSGAFNDCSGLKSVDIPEGVTSIGSMAFVEDGELESVKIPKSVTSIGFMAFCECTGLSEVTIAGDGTDIGQQAFAFCAKLKEVTIAGDGTSIGVKAFYECKGLETLDLQEGVANIDVDAFAYCEKLTEVTIPGSVESIGRNAFTMCSGLEKVDIQRGVKTIVSEAFSDCSELKEVTIAGGVTDIGAYAFASCAKLKEVTIPGSVTSLGSGVFFNCTGLEKIVSLAEQPASYSSGFSDVKTIIVPEGTTEAYEKAWGAGNYVELSRTIVDGGLKYEVNEDWESVTVVNSSEAMEMVEIEIPSVVKEQGVEFSVTSIGKGAFDSYAIIESVTIPEGVTSIGVGAFEYCVRLSSVAIPKSVEGIGDMAFSNCERLRSVEMQDGVTSIGQGAFFGCRFLKSVEIPGSVTSIGDMAFASCGLKEVTSLSAEPQRLSAGTFTGVDLSGATLYVPAEAKDKYKQANVWKDFGKTIGYIAKGDGWVIDGDGMLTVWKDFEYSSGDGYPWYSYKESIESVMVAEGVTVIGEEAFIGFGGIEQVVIAEGVESIGVDAFYACSGLKSVEIPASVERIEESAFCNCSGLKSIEVAGGNAKYDSRGSCNAIIEKERSMLLAGCKNTVIPEDVVRIGEYAFTGCSEMASVTIPASVTGIGGFSFFGCRGLKEVTSMSVTPQELEEGRIWTFNEVEVSSATLYVPAEAVEEYKKAPVWNRFGTIVGLIAKGDGWMIDGEGVLTVWKNFEGEWASLYPWYDYCSSVKRIVVKEGVTKVGKQEFYACSSVTDVEIASSVESIGEAAFYYCMSLKSVTIPEGVTSIGGGVFEGCSGLESVTSLSTTPVSLEPGSLGIEDKSKVTLYVPTGAVEEYKKAEEWKDFGKTVGFIGKGDGWMIDGEGELTVWKDFECDWSSQYPWDAYRTSIKELKITEDVRVIGKQAFAGCTSLESVRIPEGVTSIGDMAFNSCKKLTGELWIPSSVTSIGRQAFFDCIKVESIGVSEWNEKYDSREDCNAIIETATNKLIRGCDNTTIPSSIKVIGEGAFSNCRGLKSVEIPESVTSIEWFSFMGCGNLKDMIVWPTTPVEITENVFFGDGVSGKTLYVPQGAIEAYKSAAVWKDFKKIVGVVKVRFEDWNGTEIKTETVEYGGSATAPEVPMRPEVEEGMMECTGWDKEFANVTEDMTVTMTYKVKTFSVRFEDWDGTELKSETVEYGQGATAPEEPKREGYDFTGWDAEYANVTEDLTVKATYSVKTFTVKFEDWDGTELKSETVAYGQGATAPEEPKREGYDFTGWDTEFANVTEDVTVKATYAEKVVTAVRKMEMEVGGPWYDLLGRKYDSKPSKAGVYFHNGKKVIVK